MWQCWILDIVSILVSRSKNHTSRIHILSVLCLTCLMVTSITYDILPNSVVENLFPNVNIYIFRHNFLQTISIRWKYSFTIILFNMTLEIVVICHDLAIEQPRIWQYPRVSEFFSLQICDSIFYETKRIFSATCTMEKLHQRFRPKCEAKCWMHRRN